MNRFFAAMLIAFALPLLTLTAILGVIRSRAAMSTFGIVFVSDRDQPNSLYFMLSDGSHVRKLRRDSKDTAASWSPDGRWLTVDADQNGIFEIYRVEPDGSQVQYASHDNLYAPNFSPDNKWLTFTARWDGNFEIYTMRLQDKSLHNLTKHATDDYNPKWSPPIDMFWRSWLNAGIGVTILIVGIVLKFKNGTFLGRHP